MRPGPTADFVITAPSYTVFDAFAEYQLTDRLSARINVYNLADETYFLSFGQAQSIPAPARSATFTLTYSY